MAEATANQQQTNMSETRGKAVILDLHHPYTECMCTPVLPCYLHGKRPSLPYDQKSEHGNQAVLTSTRLHTTAKSQLALVLLESLPRRGQPGRKDRSRYSICRVKTAFETDQVYTVTILSASHPLCEITQELP